MKFILVCENASVFKLPCRTSNVMHFTVLNIMGNSARCCLLLHHPTTIRYIEWELPILLEAHFITWKVNVC